ncbi:hypothetical protein HanPI659440_Chr14g0549751 [Helianthus annuus]|nr:hypothetical protein HanPI659440_Chr14g0549751 [Helianthus annuus]
MCLYLYTFEMMLETDGELFQAINDTRRRFEVEKHECINFRTEKVRCLLYDHI